MRKWGQLLGLVVVAGLAGAVVSQLARPAHGPAMVGEDALDRVIRTRTLRCGYVLSAPSCYRDPNSQELRGYSVECIAELGRRLDLKIEWVSEESWGTMIEGLNGRFDLVGTTAWRNASRGKACYFTVPIVYSGMVVYVRQDDTRFDRSLAAINSPDVKIGVIDGELSEVIAQEDFPKARQVALPQLSDYSQLLLEVVGRKSDVAFMENNTATLFLKKNPGTLRNITPDDPVRVFGESFLLRSGEDRLKSMLDAALTELIDSGFGDRVMARHLEAPGSKFRVARPFRPFDSPKR